MPIYSYKEGWKLTKLKVKLNNNWKSTASYVYINGVWKKALEAVPAGLIIPYNGTIAPSGWSLFTAANERYIIGAGKTYAVKSTGGSSTITCTSTTTGAHTGDTGRVGMKDKSYQGRNYRGAHCHSISFSYSPPYYGLTLIRANTELESLPPKSVMFSDRTLPLLRLEDGDGRLFSARKSIEKGGSNSISSQTSSSAGIHYHGLGKSRSYRADAGYTEAVESGQHTHTVSDFTITPNFKRVLLSAWTNASENFDLMPGMYAFYESLTPPKGWALCDGTNNTLDLRDYFIEFGNENNHGTKTGDGTISPLVGQLNTVSWNHTHLEGNKSYSRQPCCHKSYSATHGHTFSLPSSFLPPYYALSIITFKG